jgi:hypothetical protein
MQIEQVPRRFGKVGAVATFGYIFKDGTYHLMRAEITKLVGKDGRQDGFRGLVTTGAGVSSRCRELAGQEVMFRGSGLLAGETRREQIEAERAQRAEDRAALARLDSYR